MRKNTYLIFGVLILLFMSGCAHMTTKSTEFPLMYEEQPVSILILPPINESTAADAKEYYSTTIQESLAFSGFYTFPYSITTDILKREGIYDAELLADMPLAKFKEYFGADAVLFTSIKEWDLSYMILASSLTVSVESKLKSTTSDQVLWEYTGTVVVDLTANNSGGGVAGLIVSVVATAVNSAMADYVTYARQANYKALVSMPYGKYHAQHNKDQNIEFVDQTPKENKTE